MKKTYIIANQGKGTLNNVPPENIIQIGGNNMISGSITGYTFPVGTTIITGQNTITGDLGKSLGNISTLDIRGNNTINKYTKGKNWSNIGRLELHGNAALTSSDIDDLIIDIANTINTTGIGQIVLKGLCQPRTSRSDEVVLRLKTEFKKTVTTN